MPAARPFTPYNGKRYDAFVYGQRLAQVTRENIPMYGVAVGNWLALAESSVRLLDAGEPIPLGAQDQLCVVSARPAISYQTPAYAEIGGVVESFCGPRHVEVYAERLAADQGSVGQSAGEPPTAQESWSQGPKTCLFMRVNFPDDPTEPITEDGAFALMDGVNLFFVEYSSDTTSIIPTVTPLLMMPQTKAYYTLQGTGRLMSDARQVMFSAGSACASESGKPSRILAAIGLSPEQAGGSVRLGFGRYTTPEQLEHAAELINDAAAQQG